MSVDFTKDNSPEDADTIGTDKSVHEVVRKAIRCADSDDNIVLTMETAMALILEWDEVRQKTS